jgi:hypothetical protein
MARWSVACLATSVQLHQAVCSARKHSTCCPLGPNDPQAKTQHRQLNYYRNTTAVTHCAAAGPTVAYLCCFLGNGRPTLILLMLRMGSAPVRVGSELSTQRAGPLSGLGRAVGSAGQAGPGRRAILDRLGTAIGDADLKGRRGQAAQARA